MKHKLTYRCKISKNFKIGNLFFLLFLFFKTFNI